MTTNEMVHEMYLGMREAMHCPDVSVAEYEGVIAYKIEKLIAEEREACAKVADDDLNNDSYIGGYSIQDIHKIAANRIAEAIRKRGE